MFKCDLSFTTQNDWMYHKKRMLLFIDYHFSDWQVHYSHFISSNEKCTLVEKYCLVGIIFDLDPGMIGHLTWVLPPIYTANLPPIPLELSYCAEACSFRTDYGVNFSFSCDRAITWLLSCVCSSIMNQASHMCMPDEPVIYSPLRLINQKSFQHSSSNLHLYNPKSLPWIGIIPHRLAPLFIPLRLILL